MGLSPSPVRSTLTLVHVRNKLHCGVLTGCHRQWLGGGGDRGRLTYLVPDGSEAKVYVTQEGKTHKLDFPLHLGVFKVVCLRSGGLSIGV